MRFAIDTNVLLYAVGAEFPYHDPCRRLVELATEDALVASLDTIHVQIGQGDLDAVAGHHPALAAPPRR